MTCTPGQHAGEHRTCRNSGLAFELSISSLGFRPFKPPPLRASQAGSSHEYYSGTRDSEPVYGFSSNWNQLGLPANVRGNCLDALGPGLCLVRNDVVPDMNGARFHATQIGVPLT